MKTLLLCLMCLWALPAQACRLALVLVVDVSGSIDPSEYRFQMDGMAEALRDPAIVEALVFGQVALSVVQWSGVGEQEQTLPWQRMLSEEAVERFAQRIERAPRRWDNSKTALGEAMAFMRRSFDAVPDCTRRVIDVSGDGMTNAGRDTATQSKAMVPDGITVNGLAIDRVGRSVTEFYRRFVITRRTGFVMTATGYSDYPRAISDKLFREVLQPAF